MGALTHLCQILPPRLDQGSEQVNTPIPQDWLPAWLRPQGLESPTEVDTAWHRGGCTSHGGTGSVLGSAIP